MKPHPIHRRSVRRALLVLVLLLLIRGGDGTLPLPATARAEPEPGAGVRVVEEAEGVVLEWRDPTGQVSPQAADLPGLALVEIGGVRLPAHLVALHLPPPHDDAAEAPRIDIEHLEDRAWSGTVASASQPVPQTIEGDARPDIASPSVSVGTLPSAPVVVLRDGRMRGRRMVVVALSPFFEREGQVRLATRVQATVRGAVLLAENGENGETIRDILTNPAPFLSDVSPPPNPLASRPAFKVRVTDAGMQRISGAALAEAGVDLASLVPSHLHLWHYGKAIPLEEHGTADGHLGAADELRFYAPAPGDRWNSAETYWLTIEQTPTLRMATRSVLPTTAPLRTTATERGEQRGHTFYDSTLPGTDGDHWFAADMRTGPGLETPSLTIPMTPTLPLAAGTTVFTLTGSSYLSGTYTMTLQVGPSVRSASWHGVGDWSQTFVLPSTRPTDREVRVRLEPGRTPLGTNLDRLSWERPVRLTAGGGEARFRGVEGVWRYQVTEVVSTTVLYDISDAQAPVRLLAAVDDDGAAMTFEDGPGPRRYLLTGAETLPPPQLSPHTPHDLTRPLSATVLYLAPGAFHAALEPLVALRQSQGHAVAVLDVQDIYDAWSYGQVSPEAIRSFLRYAAATWNPAPFAVTLVGDGTSDPHNYLSHANPNHLPPYLAVVDPWLGETACDNCYAQLDGDTPLDDPLPDLAIGRLSVQHADELETIVAKIVGYESTSMEGVWRSRAVYVADNFSEASGETDPAGDFAAIANQGSSLQPPGVTISRVYYDPSPSHIGVPWREPDPAQAHQRTFDLLNRGAGTVTYIGHSHYWQWAVTDADRDLSYLLSVNDVDRLTNGGRLPVVLEMTCLTAAFQHPSRSGTTLDERLLLHPAGGTVAVWGATGLGVAHGHDTLQRGFLQTLWQTLPNPASVGFLAWSSYVTVFTQGTCCQDVLRTYTLLGDPLMPVWVFAAEQVYLPLMHR